MIVLFGISLSVIIFLLSNNVLIHYFLLFSLAKTACSQPSNPAKLVHLNPSDGAVTGQALSHTISDTKT